MTDAGKERIQHPDVIVVGAGILGTFHAYFAAQRGLRVLLLERNGAPSEASVRNFGMVPQSIVDPDGPWARFAADTAAIYREIQAAHDIGVTARGSLYLASTEIENAVLREFAERYAGRFGCHYLDRREVLNRYAYVQEAYVRGGLLFPRDLGLDPRSMLSRMIAYLIELGVEYRPHTAVIDVEVRGQSCAVRTAGGRTVEGGRVILCTGAEAATHFPDVLAERDLSVCKLQMMRLSPLSGVRLEHSILSGLSIRRYPAFTSCPSYPLLETEPVDERYRRHGIHVLVKQEADGTVVIGDSHQYAATSEAASLAERTDADINESILDYARSMLRLPSWRVQSLWNGYYLVHDRDPIFSATIEGRIHIVTGIGGKGMSTGPGYARESINAVLGSSG